MKKRLKKYGDSLVIVFTREDKDLFGLGEGDIIEFNEMIFEKIIKKGYKKNDK